MSMMERSRSFDLAADQGIRDGTLSDDGDNDSTGTLSSFDIEASSQGALALDEIETFFLESKQVSYLGANNCNNFESPSVIKVADYGTLSSDRSKPLTP